MQYKGEWKQYGFGFGCLFEFDIAVGYKILFMHLYTTQDNLLLNPKMYVEGTTHNYIEFMFQNVRFRFPFEFIGYKFTFLDYQFLWNLDSPLDYCQGMQWVQEMTQFRVDFEANINECDFGILGVLLQPADWYNCEWRRYILN